MKHDKQVGGRRFFLALREKMYDGPPQLPLGSTGATPCLYRAPACWLARPDESPASNRDHVGLKALQSRQWSGCRMGKMIKNVGQVFLALVFSLAAWQAPVQA